LGAAELCPQLQPCGRRKGRGVGLRQASAVILGVAAQGRGSGVGVEAGALPARPCGFRRFPAPERELRPVWSTGDGMKLKGGWVVMSLPVLNAPLS